MECGHKLTFRKTLDLITQSYFSKTIEYTCECGQKCELEFNPLYRIGTVVIALIVFICAEVLFKHLYTRYYMWNMILCVAGLAIGIAAWYGLIYAVHKLDGFKYTAVQDYKPIVNRQSLKKR